MDVQERNGIKVYSLHTGTQQLPPWLSEHGRRNLNKRDLNIRHRVQLLQDFDMPISSSKLRQSKDGRYIFASGIYPPRIKCFDLDQLGLKFERYVDADPIDLHLLSDDYGKCAILTSDRSISFHAPYGHHTNIRIPSFGRAMAYEPTTCDLLVPSSSSDIYRFNLEEGRFKSPWSCGGSGAGGGGGGTCIDVSSTHALSVVGCEDGIVRCYDNRIGGTSSSNNKSGGGAICSLDIAHILEKEGLSYMQDAELTSIALNSSGLHMACGTKGGYVPLFDMRSSKPLIVKYHQNGLPIHTVTFHDGASSVISSDAKLIKIWSTRQHVDENKKDLVNIESKVDLTHVMIASDVYDPKGSNSGLLLCASEDPRIQAYYCPTLGAAPRWCSFLDNITEELEEDNIRSSMEGGGMGTSGNSGTMESVYDDYKFVTREEVDKLGISNLIGTTLLRGYMHGYFINMGLYTKVKAVANPFEYDEYRRQKIKQKLDNQQSSRIVLSSSNDNKKDKSKQKKKTRDRNIKVNADFARRMEEKATGLKTSKQVAQTAKNVLEDDRFRSMFQNVDFQVNEDDEAFKLRNASGVAATTTARDDDVDSDNDNIGIEDEGSATSFDKHDNRRASSVLSDDDVFDSDNDSDNDYGVKYDDGRSRERINISKKQERRKGKQQRVIQTQGDDELTKKHIPKTKQTFKVLTVEERLRQEEDNAAEKKETTTNNSNKHITIKRQGMSRSAVIDSSKRNSGNSMHKKKRKQG